MSEEKDLFKPKYRKLNGPIRWYFLIASFLALASGIFYNFYLSIGKWTFSSTQYLYWLITLYLPLVFIIFPPLKKVKYIERVIWYDYLIAIATFCSGLFCAYYALDIQILAWEVIAPWHAKIFALILFLSVLESCRRTSGNAFFFVALFFGTYALYANVMPSFLHGKSYSFWRVICYHVMGPESIVGLPMRTTGSLLIGFMIFAVALMHTGAGNFFLEIAQSVLGSVRGGAAKVSVLSSALMGSISGSVMSNVLSTGSFTIPAMKRSGYPPHFAAAVEACASSGGTLMPPIMGAAAFIMAGMLQVPYVHIISAAVIPSLLYFLCLLLQADAYAALHGIKGMPRSDCPVFSEVMKRGWFYLLALGVLVFMVVFLYREAQAAWVSTLILIFVTSFRKETRFNWKKFLDFIEGTGKFMAEITSILAACGLMVGSMIFTGMASSFANEVLNLAGNNLYLLLILGAVASFVLGMGMTIAACYIFLALIMAPALVKGGFHPLAVHLFIIYWGMASYITPPVAMGSFAAATLAGSDPIKTGIQSCKLGLAKYLLPFFFVLNPALILQGSIKDILLSFSTCVIGIYLISGAMEGYLLFYGKLPRWSKLPILISGVLLGFPSITTDLYGLIAAVITMLALKMFNNNFKNANAY